MFKGQTALVTGSTSGIGLGIARALAAQGANLVINGLGDAAAIEKLRASLASEFGVRVAYDAADMTRPAEIAAMVDAALARGSLDILVNNAGIQHVAPIEEFPLDKWDQIIAINMSSAFHSIRAALPAMKKANRGRIINIASAHGLRASPNKVAYVAAKHGVVGITKTVALECAQTNITCNAICPGFVLTPLVEKQVQDQMKALGLPRGQVERDVIMQKQPTKRFVTIEQVAAMAVFLAGEGAASITGMAYAIDGGWTAQ
jgi:3-hydroxybutyrate dehydrogenase